MYYPRKYNKRVYKKKRVYRKPKKVIKSKRLAKTIQKVINKNAETKLANINTGASLVLFNSGINTTADMRQIVPNVTRGTADNERIGDQVTGQKLQIRGYLRAQINTVASTTGLPQIIARLMVVSLKTKSNYTEVVSSSAPLNALLKRGGTTTNFAGFLNDIYADINTELWTKHYDKRFYLSQDYLVTGSGAVDISKGLKFFKINVKCKKLIKYDDSISSSLLPTNFSPILILGYAFADGTPPDTTTTNVGLCFDSDFYYQDM